MYLKRRKLNGESFDTTAQTTSNVLTNSAIDIEETPGTIYYNTATMSVRLFDGTNWSTLTMVADPPAWTELAMESATTPAPNVVTHSTGYWPGWHLFNGTAGPGDSWHSLTGTGFTPNVDYAGTQGLTGIAKKGDWVTVDRGTPYRVTGYTLWGRIESFDGQPLDFDIVYSTDGTNWTSAHRVVDCGISRTVPYQSDFPGGKINARYWGVQVTRSNSNFVILSDLTFY